MIYTHSGNSGDIVFSIPTILELEKRHASSEAILYIKPVKYTSPNGNQYEFVKDLLLQNGIKSLPFVPPDNNWNYFKWTGLKYDYDLDNARKQRNRGVVHIIKRYFDAFGVQKDHRVPFLKVDDLYKRDEKFALIHLTPRWSGLQYNWKRIYAEAKERHKKVYFVGFQCEWLDFTIRFGEIEHIPTETLLDLARLVRDCEALYCNQGVVLTLAQGLGKPYYLAKNGNRTNCVLGTSNEHICGPQYLIPHHTLTKEMLPDAHLVR